MAAEGNELVKLVQLVGRGARLSVKPLLVLIFGSSVTTLMTVVYFHWAMQMNWWWSLTPLFLMVLPLLGLVYYWCTLDGISRLPEVLVESKETWAELKRRHAQRKKKREIRGIGPIATTRRMILLGGLLWDSRDVIDTASNIYGLMDLFNPLFWLLKLISVGGALVLSTCYVLICAGHFVFS